MFIACGEKIAYEWLSADGDVAMIVATEDWVAQNSQLISRHPEATLHMVKERELEDISPLQAPNGVLLVVPLPAKRVLPVLTGWCIALDAIQDPGNMGTIIRIADWFGIGTIICSPGCADVYNPKVVQSAMGGHLRVGVYEEDLAPVLKRTTLPKYAAVLDGENVYKAKRADVGVLVIGNESKGISADVLAAATHKITIPKKGGAESLNAGVSAGILCALLLPC